MNVYENFEEGSETRHPPLLQSSLASPIFFLADSRVSALRVAVLDARACAGLVGAFR